MLQKYINSKRKILKWKKYPSCLGNVSVDFSANSMTKRGLDESVHNFSVDYSIIDASNIINIHKYLMKKHDKK